MQEYTGQLLGGPDNGNFVTASLPEIAVVSTTELWLDGVGEGKTINIIIIKGRYIWKENSGRFVWKLDDTKFDTKTMEPA